jgi:hypothetical protein
VDLDAIWGAVRLERERQHAKWQGQHPWGAGDCSSSDVLVTTKVAVLTEECGEVSRAVLERDPEQTQRELIQVAAVAVAWLEGEPC